MKIIKLTKLVDAYFDALVWSVGVHLNSSEGFKV